MQNLSNRRRAGPLLGIACLISFTAFGQPPNRDQNTALGSLELSWFYKPPVDGTSTQTMATQFQHFILTRNDEDLRDHLRAAGVSTPILQYVRFDAIEDPCDGQCPCKAMPWRNQVAWEPGDFCEILSNHPDWFLRSKAGDLIAVKTGHQRHLWMDPGNPGWRAFWLNRVKMTQKELGWQGVFLDNVQASLGQFTKENIALSNYPNEANFQTAVKGFLDYIRNIYFIPEKRTLEGNIIFLPWGQEKVIWKYFLASMDGAMLEDFAVGWHSGSFKTSQDWLNQIQSIEESQRMGKHVTLVAQGDQEDLGRQTFALASYLLSNEGLASFRYTDSHGHYNQFWDYDGYQTARHLGRSLKPREKLETGIWRRDFENGYVTVDPDNHQGQIILLPQHLNP